MVTDDVSVLAKDGVVRVDEAAADVASLVVRKRRRVKRHAWRRAVLRKRGEVYALKVFRHEQRHKLAGRRIFIDEVGALMTSRMARVDRSARRIFLLSSKRRGADGAAAAVDRGKPLHALPALENFPRLSARHL